MNSRVLKYLLIVFVGVFFIVGGLEAQGRHHRRVVKADVTQKKISKKAIPSAVLSAFQEKFPTASITGQIKEIRERIPFYEIQSTDSGKTHDVLFQEDGTIVEIAESIDTTRLPQKIKDGLRDKYPVAEIESAECVTRGSHVEYEIILKAGRKKLEVIANTAGKIFQLR